MKMIGGRGHGGGRRHEDQGAQPQRQLPRCSWAMLCSALCSDFFVTPCAADALPAALRPLCLRQADGKDFTVGIADVVHGEKIFKYKIRELLDDDDPLGTKIHLYQKVCSADECLSSVELGSFAGGNPKSSSWTAFTGTDANAYTVDVSLSGLDLEEQETCTKHNMVALSSNYEDSHGGYYSALQLKVCCWRVPGGNSPAAASGDTDYTSALLPLPLDDQPSCLREGLSPASSAPGFSKGVEDLQFSYETSSGSDVEKRHKYRLGIPTTNAGKGVDCSKSGVEDEGTCSKYTNGTIQTRGNKAGSAKNECCFEPAWGKGNVLAQLKRKECNKSGNTCARDDFPDIYDHFVLGGFTLTEQTISWKRNGDECFPRACTKTTTTTTSAPSCPAGSPPNGYTLPECVCCLDDQVTVSGLGLVEQSTCSKHKMKRNSGDFSADEEDFVKLELQVCCKDAYKSAKNNVPTSLKTAREDAEDALASGDATLAETKAAKAKKLAAEALAGAAEETVYPQKFTVFPQWALIEQVNAATYAASKAAAKAAAAASDGDGDGDGDGAGDGANNNNDGDDDDKTAFIVIAVVGVVLVFLGIVYVCALSNTLDHHNALEDDYGMHGGPGMKGKGKGGGKYGYPGPGMKGMGKGGGKHGYPGPGMKGKGKKGKWGW